MEEEFDRLHITEPAVPAVDVSSLKPKKIAELLRQFLDVQQLRSVAYSRLKSGFEDYMHSRNELPYQQICAEITSEFNHCSKQVLQIETQFKSPDCSRNDLATLLRSVQELEKEKLELTVKVQLLKKDGLPSKRIVSHDRCTPFHHTGHQCANIEPITEALGTEEAEADAQYDADLKNCIKSLQDAVVAINEYLEVVRYEIADLDEQQ